MNISTTYLTTRLQNSAAGITQVAQLMRAGETVISHSELLSVFTVELLACLSVMADEGLFDYEAAFSKDAVIAKREEIKRELDFGLVS